MHTNLCFVFVNITTSVRYSRFVRSIVFYAPHPREKVQRMGVWVWVQCIFYAWVKEDIITEHRSLFVDISNFLTYQQSIGTGSNTLLEDSTLWQMIGEGSSRPQWVAAVRHLISSKGSSNIGQGHQDAVQQCHLCIIRNCWLYCSCPPFLFTLACLGLPPTA